MIYLYILDLKSPMISLEENRDLMRKDTFKKRRKKSMSNWFEEMVERLGGRAIAIASLSMLVIIIAIIVLIVIKISSMDK